MAPSVDPVNDTVPTVTTTTRNVHQNRLIAAERFSEALDVYFSDHRRVENEALQAYHRAMIGVELRFTRAINQVIRILQNGGDNQTTSGLLNFVVSLNRERLDENRSWNDEMTSMRRLMRTTSNNGSNNLDNDFQAE